MMDYKKVARETVETCSPGCIKCSYRVRSVAQALERAALEGKIEGMEWVFNKNVMEIELEVIALRKRLEELGK